MSSPSPLHEASNHPLLPLTRYFIKQFAFSWWKVDILVSALSAMNRPVDLFCIRCPPRAQLVGYDSKRHAVWVCGIVFWNPFELRRQIAHSLINAFDHSRTEIETNEHLACTEIRGWNISGECELWRRFFEYAGDDWLGTGWWSRKQKCVREGAIGGMMRTGGQDREAASQSVDLVFNRCFKDHWPFTTQPHMDTRYRDSPMSNR